MDRIEADWLKAAETQKVFRLLGDHPTYVVGGCVRNTLLGVPVKDVDFATSARPEEVTRLSEHAGVRAVPTGIEHGTVTIVIEDKPFEVTTFRRDIDTDGRRSTVAFSESLAVDARRRDFTVNAIYADKDGVLLDPVDGLPDIAARRIRFIEDADRRIREDYLRSLRFFRFSAWYADPDAGFEADTLSAIARNLQGLETLSRERVGSELMQLLAAPDPVHAVAAMRATGVLRTVLPGSDDIGLGPLVHLEKQLNVEPSGIRRLATIGGAVENLRLSRSDLTKVEVIRANLGRPAHAAGYFLGGDTGRDTVVVGAALSGQPLSRNSLEDVRRGASAKFPVSAGDLMPGLKGKPLGDRLKELENKWVESEFTLTRDTLLGNG